jgi:hypothetical protein
MADTLASGASERKLVGVQIPPRPPKLLESSGPRPWFRGRGSAAGGPLKWFATRPEAGGVNHRLVPLATALLVAITACGASGRVGLHPPERRPRPGLSIGARNDSQRPTSDVGSSTKGDLKTFAYASSDAKALATEVTGVAAPGGASNVSYDAVALIDDAHRLERLAVAAKRRLKAVDPTNPMLVDARRQGMAVFSLTADYARLVIDLGNADKNDNLALLNAVANDALALEGTGDQLGASLSALIADLHGWAKTHPQAAARARAEFGD